MIFKYFSKMDVPLVGAKRSYHPNTFCFCILTRFFLVHEAPCVDPGIVHMINNLESVSPMAIILAKTLNGLDSVHREEAKFFAGSPLLLQV